MDTPTYHMLWFEDLNGWNDDNHQAAIDVFLSTCADMAQPEWNIICALAHQAQNAKAFFEEVFQPVLIEDGRDALFTGYYEPEFEGARQCGGAYQHPIYRMPAHVTQPWLTRREIEQTAALDGQNLEIVWLDNSVDVFFLQVQGSGRVRLRDGDVIRVGYGGANGHPYASIGQELVRRGVFQAQDVSADAIRDWVMANPEDGTALLQTNASYVFFREVSEVPPECGPLGAMNRSVTALRTLAVDPAYIPLGAPVWMEKAGPTPMSRLMVAQDTGSAIKGAQRADIFFGTGAEAGQQAGRIKDGGRLVVLMPQTLAQALLQDVRV